MTKHMMGVLPSTISTISELSEAENDMREISLFRSVKRFFDFCDESQPDLTGLPDVILNTLQIPHFQRIRADIGLLIDHIDPQWTIVLGDLSDHSYDINTDDYILSLNSNGLTEARIATSESDQCRILVALIEGLRMVRHIEWFDRALNRYHPQAIMEIGRISVADCSTQMIAVAWTAKNAGQDRLWRHILCGDTADMALCYDRVMELGVHKALPPHIAMKEAMSLTFRTWFTDPQRIKETDHDTLNLLDSMLVENMVFGHAVIQRPTIACLTLRLGSEGTYLDQAVLRDMMINPFYKDVDDRVNKIHLAQIIRDSNLCEIAGIPFRDPHLAQRFA